MVMKMSLRDHKNFNGIVFPQKETELGNLTAKQLLDKIDAFYLRFNPELTLGDMAESYFLQFLTYYPVSMCSYNMTTALKLVIALIYFSNKPTEEEIAKKNDLWDGYSYEDLALIFDRSKASIHAAIKEKETEALAIIQAAKLKSQVTKAALQELIEEEKQRIKKTKLENEGVTE
jgi:hypothetical protein